MALVYLIKGNIIMTKLIRVHKYFMLFYLYFCTYTFRFCCPWRNRELILKIFLSRTPKLGAIKGTSREKFYQELGLESLRKRRWYRKLCYFFKIFKRQSPENLFRILPSVSKAYNTKTDDKILLFSGKHIFL